MEIIENRYGTERVLTQLDGNRIRIMGESLFSRVSTDDNSNITMYDFEGGPCLNVGGKIKFRGVDFKIQAIQQEENDADDLVSVVLDVIF